jgi:hypothetical protein
MSCIDRKPLLTLVLSGRAGRRVAHVPPSAAGAWDA